MAAKSSKSAAKKKSVSKKAVAKPAAKKPAAKKPAAKKPAAKKPAAKKPAAKKPAARAKKPAAKKPASRAKKPAAKKPAAKKPAARTRKPAPPAAAAADTPLDLLLADVTAFNSWRMNHRDAALDLRDADLAGADLHEALLAGATLDGAMLDDADLRGALLAGASLDGASLRRADLRGACFGYAELMSAELLNTRLGDALTKGASLRGAKLDAARAQEAVFTECDLTGAIVKDCDFTGANVSRTILEGNVPPAPPSIEDREALWERLGAEPLPVREGMFRAALLVFLAGDQSDDGAGFLSGLAEELGFSQDDVDRIMPSGKVMLERMGMAPPTTHWARRMTLVMLFGMIQTSATVEPMQLQVLGHFGELLGFSDRAMMRLIREELSIEVSISARS